AIPHHTPVASRGALLRRRRVVVHEGRIPLQQYAKGAAKNRGQLFASPLLLLQSRPELAQLPLLQSLPILAQLPPSLEPALLYCFSPFLKVGWVFFTSVLQLVKVNLCIRVGFAAPSLAMFLR